MKILPKMLSDGPKTSFWPPGWSNGWHLPLESVQPAKNQQALVFQKWWILQKKDSKILEKFEMCPKKAQKASFLGLFLGQQANEW